MFIDILKAIGKAIFNFVVFIFSTFFEYIRAIANLVVLFFMLVATLVFFIPGLIFLIMAIVKQINGIGFFGDWSGQVAILSLGIYFVIFLIGQIILNYIINR